jgi:hypothetical protein
MAMRSLLLALLVVTGSLMTASFAVAQNFAVGYGSDFRTEFTVDSTRRGPAVTGWVFNPRPYPLMKVQIRIDVLDVSGNVVGQRYGWVSGEVPGDGRGYFHVPLGIAGTSYRVAVVHYEPLTKGGD